MSFGFEKDADGVELPPEDSLSTSVTRVPPARRALGSKEMRELQDRLTAQQASLVRSMALSDPDYLNRSFYLDPKTGKRVAYELEPNELTGFTASWVVAPMECIRGMNRAMSRIEEPARRERYVRAAVDLEILMDQHSWVDDGRVYQGIPGYLMHGYTDMGTQASPTERVGREKIKVDKVRMARRLVECKRRGVTASANRDRTTGDGSEPLGEAALEKLLTWYYNSVRRDIEFNEIGVEKLSRDFGNESIVLSKYLEKGLGVCRHLSIFFQIYLQEAGIDCKLVKGDLKFYIFKGRHAWNLVKRDGTHILVDVTHPNVSQPFFVVGASEAEVYQRAGELSREYAPTPDEQNHYKIGAA